MFTVSGVVKIPDSELSLSFARSSGPGGQNVNKVNSKAILVWSFASSQALVGLARERFLRKFGHRLTKEGTLVITSQRHRDQAKNVADCHEKLADMIRGILTAPKTRRATKPTHGSRERRLTDKKRRSETKSRRRSVDD